MQIFLDTFPRWVHYVLVPKPETKVRFENKAQRERIERAARQEKRSLNQFLVLAAEERAFRVNQASIAETRKAGANFFEPSVTS